MQELIVTSSHIDMAYHFIRDVISREQVHREYKPASGMVAEQLTRAF